MDANQYFSPWDDHQDAHQERVNERHARTLDTLRRVASGTSTIEDAVFLGVECGIDSREIIREIISNVMNTLTPKAGGE